MMPTPKERKFTNALARHMAAREIQNGADIEAEFNQLVRHKVLTRVEVNRMKRQAAEKQRWFCSAIKEIKKRLDTLP
jgi:hypothetical protein